MEKSNIKRKIAILGSTGSIGTQALEVVRQHPDKFEVSVLTAYSNSSLLKQQAIEFKPNTVVIVEDKTYEALSAELWELGIKTYTGESALCDAVQIEEIDIVLTALVGFAGLKPTIAAIEAKKPIALANKETLVVAGQLITHLATENSVPILPVDSEHSAIFQCLIGEFHNPIEKIYLTASGGPFRGWSEDELKTVSPSAALKHPNWEMGAKITIDSATLMNKGLEVIEAKWLFNLNEDQIDVIVHPESILHSIVQFKDGSMKAQMGLPDMKLPIQYALAYPDRIDSSFPRFDFLQYPKLHFEKADGETFMNLNLAYEALSMKGTAACALNAANEVTNQAFRDHQISFLDIAKINQTVLHESTSCMSPSLEDYLEADQEARSLAKTQIR
ncbi:MAG: 1-deoxy-D-xylulose-5-phosphate reductoisomerase [Verrucomicrobia bacterium]|nr:1-deoxy-D-xylulose-5-phosphate reductoisomerase [Verrucomicrobiota bacterium]